MLGALAPLCAWSEAPVVEQAYVSIVPAGETDVDSVLEFQRGIELVLCQAGVRQRLEAAHHRAELKLSASLMKAEFRTQSGQTLRECELTEASATLPDGAHIPLPDVAISSQSAMPRRGATDPFFLACGANIARTALDALKEKVALRGASCDAPSATSRSARSPARASPRKR